MKAPKAEKASGPDYDDLLRAADVLHDLYLLFNGPAYNGAGSSFHDCLSRELLRAQMILNKISGDTRW